MSGPKRPEYEPKGFDQCLAYLIEEMGECLGAAGKTLRWGPDSYNPELPPKQRELNIDWLLREIEDVEAAIVRFRREASR